MIKKTIIAAITIACAATVVLSGCGGTSSKPVASGNVAPSSASSIETATDSTFDVGNFTVAVPAGWTAIPQTNILDDADAEGKKPIDPAHIVVVKSTDQNEEDYSKPSVRIYYYDTNTMVQDAKDLYENVKDLSGVKINGIDCPAYSGETLGYVYQCIQYQPQDAQYAIQILTSVDGKDTGISWDDPDVKTILESIAKK